MHTTTPVYSSSHSPQDRIFKLNADGMYVRFQAQWSLR